ncbi:hypothetical protein Q361_1624 [Flavobacterium croceum DSM 17960]|uniref:Uncharacterized protein n=1 Tax=Flavobacterium croceum DSM 17960 TaxID=1121886 RepID=A0A2S4N4E5_9FLAO|nr:hypothetical protein [Flavobacterium croceum]POS00555.1 hypothetical protein Q361_1624 [Flavobacterium croceum DSM 17960]
MAKFKIYTKDKKFYVTDNKLYLVQVILLTPGLIHLIFFKDKEYHNLEVSLLWISLIYMIISMFLNWTSFARYRPLEGKIEGEIILSEEEILIENEVIKIKDIKNIEITNDDFLNFMKSYNKYVMLGRKSYGVENEIKITLINGKLYKINYQQDQNHDMQECKELLKLYFKKGIISLENLMYVLGIVEVEEKTEFKKSLEI